MRHRIESKSLGLGFYSVPYNPIPTEILKTFIKPIQERLGMWERPVVTGYELGVMTATQVTDGFDLPSLYKEVVRALTSVGLISPAKEFKTSTVFQLFGRNKPLPMEIACSIDPFAYVSHLSPWNTTALRIDSPKFCTCQRHLTESGKSRLLRG